MFEISSMQTTGLMALDSDTTLPKSSRGGLLLNGVTKYPESTESLGDFKSKRLTEPGNVLFWKHEPGVPRGAWGSWSFGLPARHKGNNEFRPLGTRTAEDLDFVRLPVHVLNSVPGRRIPQDLDAVVFATAGHGTHDKVAIVPGFGSSLIAHWRGNQPPDYSSHVFDISGDARDPIRHAGLDTIFEVRRWAAPCSASTSSAGPEYTIALNGRASPEGMGFLHVSFGDKDALFSYMGGGPLIPSFSAKHRLVRTGDADLNAGGITTNAFFVGSKMPFTAPLAFEEELYPPVLNGDIPYEVHRQYDGSITHPFPCGPKQGQWREFVKLPIAETPPCTPTKDYSALDANSNPDRTYSEGTRLVLPRVSQTQGLYFAGRANMMLGRRTT